MKWTTQFDLCIHISESAASVDGEEVANVTMEDRETIVVFNRDARKFWFIHSGGAIASVPLNELFARVASDLNYFTSVNPKGEAK